MFAVAQNLHSLARLHADAERYPTALALYDESLKWAKRAEGLPHASDFVQVLTRERSTVRQQETMAQAAADCYGRRSPSMTQLGFLLCLTGLLVAPMITALMRRSTRGQRADAVLTTGALLIGAAVGAIVLWRGENAGLDLSRFTLFAVAFKVDRLSAFFLSLVCIVAAPATLFSIPYARQHYPDGRVTWFWVFLPWFVLSMVMVVTAATGFAFSIRVGADDIALCRSDPAGGRFRRSPA